jgi:hypothetical protein
MTVMAFQDMTRLKTDTLSVRQLLVDGAFESSPYQRPEQWMGKHIAQVFSDLTQHRDKSAYRLGTVVLHRNGKHNNIVYGQQRTISLILILIVHAHLQYACIRAHSSARKRPQLCVSSKRNHYVGHRGIGKWST